jgi:hypothetical protein
MFIFSFLTRISPTGRMTPRMMPPHACRHIPLDEPQPRVHTLEPENPVFARSLLSLEEGCALSITAAY